MSLKLPSIFIIAVISLVSIHSVYGTTADELLKHNPTAMDIQAAVDNGSINYSDLPPSFQINIHDHEISYNKYLLNHQNNSNIDSPTTKSNTSIGNSLFILIIVLLVMISLPIIILRFVSGDSEEKTKTNLLHNLLLKLGIIKTKSTSKKIESYTTEEDKDSSNLDSSFQDHDYSESVGYEKVKVKSRKQVTNKIKTHHSILVSLGLAKVVKKDA